VYQKIKTFTWTLLYLLLWVRFFIAIFDPVTSGLSLEQGLAFYRDWRPAFDWIYAISGYIMVPVYWLYGWIGPLIPQNNWFPGIYVGQLLQLVVQLSASQPAIQSAFQTPFIQQGLVGYIDWLVLIAVLFYRGLSPIMDGLYDFLKNLVWNLMIEFSFTKTKESKYREALEKKASDLMKLNVEYRNLSKEASMLAHSVITDELTKVYNKRFFINKITECFQSAKQGKTILAIAMVDIDHFKKLNDNYGHLLGDKVLQAVAHIAKRNTPGDCFCCRFGGEEFSIIMPGKTTEQAFQIASTIHRNLPLLRFEEDPELRVTASFGVCVADFRLDSAQTLNTFEDFIKLADDELYRAKLNGRNRIECNTLQ
jgi:diguanylate cyclase (GGDEF)-like protein